MPASRGRVEDAPEFNDEGEEVCVRCGEPFERKEEITDDEMDGRKALHYIHSTREVATGEVIDRDCMVFEGDRSDPDRDPEHESTVDMDLNRGDEG